MNELIDSIRNLAYFIKRYMVKNDLKIFLLSGMQLIFTLGQTSSKTKPMGTDVDSQIWLFLFLGFLFF